MNDSIKLINQRASILDLSSVTDIHGAKVVLQPKDQPRSSRECPAEAEHHPDVEAFVAIDWVRVERPHARPVQKLAVSPVPKKAEPPAPPAPPAPVVEDVPPAAEPTPDVPPSAPVALEEFEEPAAQDDMTAFAGAEPATLESVEAALEEKDAAPDDAGPADTDATSGKRRRKNR